MNSFFVALLVFPNLLESVLFALSGIFRKFSKALCFLCNIRPGLLNRPKSAAAGLIAVFPKPYTGGLSGQFSPLANMSHFEKAKRTDRHLCLLALTTAFGRRSAICPIIYLWTSWASLWGVASPYRLGQFSRSRQMSTSSRHDQAN